MLPYAAGHLEDVPDYLKKSEEFAGTRAALEPGLNFCKVRETVNLFYEYTPPCTCSAHANCALTCTCSAHDLHEPSQRYPVVWLVLQQLLEVEHGGLVIVLPASRLFQ